MMFDRLKWVCVSIGLSDWLWLIVLVNRSIDRPIS
jgi:hypothetical protein